jgi:hypothetical protein
VKTDLELIWGAKAIAEAIGRTRVATYHMLERGQIPGCKRVGKRWVVSRQRLRDHFDGAGEVKLDGAAQR